MHLKVKQLTEYYGKGLLTEREYWDKRFEITLPELIRKRTALSKEMGLLSKYLGEFSILGAYSRMMKGEEIDHYKKQAELNKYNFEKEKRYKKLREEQLESLRKAIK